MSMSSISIAELMAFVLYFVFVLAIGMWFMLRSRGEGVGEYFLGGRKMGPWVTAMSAQASDMSGWLLMGFPGSILAAGMGKIWIAVGLSLGTYLNWKLVASRLRRFTMASDDAITIPEYLTKRFKSKNYMLQIICAIVFLVCFTIYVASGFKAGGAVFSSVLGVSEEIAFIVFAVIILVYTFMGGFHAVCWTDFFQGLMMLVAIVITPIIVCMQNELDFSAVTSTAENYWNLLPSGRLDYASISSILGDLAWGLGYFGMPHIIIRFMAISDSRKIKQSRKIAMTWVVITLFAAVVIGLVGRVYLPELATNGSDRVFIEMVRRVFPGFIAGILLSAIIAASMSTADSQLLVASSSITNDIYKPIIRKKASGKELLWIGRLVVVLVSVVAFFIANNPNSGSIMDLVSNAWAGFGAAFGPVIILTLYWKRFTYKGAVAGIICGGGTVALWITFLSASTGIYELLPGFIVGFAACILVSMLDKEPSKEVSEIYEKATDESLEF